MINSVIQTDGCHGCSGLSMGIILMAAFSLYTAFYPMRFNLFRDNIKKRH
jgi:hypothetical protein